MVRLQQTMTVTPTVNNFTGEKCSLGILAKSHETLAHLAVLFNKVPPTGNWATSPQRSCGPRELICHLILLQPPLTILQHLIDSGPQLAFSDSPGCRLPGRGTPEQNHLVLLWGSSPPFPPRTVHITAQSFLTCALPRSGRWLKHLSPRTCLGP